MTNADYFARYEAIAAVSERMLCAARGAHWDDLIDLQEEYRHLVDALKAADGGTQLSTHERARKFELIRQILADDAAIRELASPCMTRLAVLFAGKTRPGRVLQELYGVR
ncbi:MAG: flagellar protein FliT [Paraburkholderia sp.]|uniref:flagellar protein FliT n=1 Tax=Paraburkholderia sp. TaxID=1926495 RepID=UPI001228714C|nr:flagellar protein FliT [Paraburkholderia sp.]TAM08331.1 MAG: flagellar protein FliT [Paraburkholderia sp.]TAM28554.1 MAG: flagellar protein FliT [Paraburkholderia sp.]